MRILLLSFFYPPDLSAGAFRTKSIVDALKGHGLGDLKVHVISSMPNRYSSFNAPTLKRSNKDGVFIYRTPLLFKNDNKFTQILTFVTFGILAWREARKYNWDIVVATSGRLFTASLASTIARRYKAPLYIDVRDLFVDTISDLSKGKLIYLFVPIFTWIEKITLRSAQKINLVSYGFIPYVNKIIPNKIFGTFSNGIDEDFLLYNFSKPKILTNKIPLIVYAGNFGDGQGLHYIIPQVAKLMGNTVRFRLIGDGNRMAELKNVILKLNLSNVELLPPVKREELLYHYKEADILFLHLNNHLAFEKVLPSKIFEYAATKKPILAGVGGYAAKFIKAQIIGSEVFMPHDSSGMILAIKKIIKRKSNINRDVFCKKYSRKVIMAQMAKDILSIKVKYAKYS